MPTTRRRRTRNLVLRDGLTEGAIEFFLHGPYFCEAQEFERETTEPERTTLWTRHKREIMARFMEQLLAQRKPQYFAGTRPDFFWADLERAGHTRQQTGTSTYPDTWPRKAWLTAPVFESDWQFLARLGLLEPWEREAGDPGKGKGISK